MNVLSNYGKFEGFNVVVTSKPQREPQRSSRTLCDLLSSPWNDTLFYKHDKVQWYWAEQAAAADLSVEQWESVLISGLNNGRMTWSLTDSERAAGSTLQTGEAASQSNNTAKKHLCVFLFPLPESFMCFGTSGTHNSKVNSQNSEHHHEHNLVEGNELLLNNWAWANLRYVWCRDLGKNLRKHNLLSRFEVVIQHFEKFAF